MGQQGDDEVELRGIETQLREDYPRLESRLRGGGSFFLVLRITVGMGLLTLSLAIIRHKHGAGIGTVFFEVILLIVGTTEVAGRSKQLAVLLRHRHQRAAKVDPPKHT